jgi:hypothetical protein
MQEISHTELFEGFLGHGLFAEKIPQFLTSKPFYDFCMIQPTEILFEKKEKRFIHYESMRNINVPRILSIPDPIAYRNQCKVLAEHWPAIQDYFRNKTSSHTHKYSRIHIRKISHNDGFDFEKHLFEMNHKDFYQDDYPEPHLMIGKNFIVKADISNCFPSIYTHSIAWALVGKVYSKTHRSNSEWFNQIDLMTRNLKDAETHGILIGSHSSNLISEIILVAVDHEMHHKGYEYIRNIDDYTYFAKTHENAETFLVELAAQLKKFGLSLNHKKTEISKLPLASTEHWIRKLNTYTFVDESRPLKLNEIRAYLDIALDLMQRNKDNAAILNYVIKVLSAKELTERAKDYYVKTIHHLVLLYPYLIFLIEEKLFDTFGIDPVYIKKIAQDIYAVGKEKLLFEAMSYAIYFGLKYDFSLGNELIEDAENYHDCIFRLLAYLHDKKFHASTINKRRYTTLAKDLYTLEMDEFWLFCYEVLPKSILASYWKKMKESSLTFIRDGFGG